MKTTFDSSARARKAPRSYPRREELAGEKAGLAVGDILLTLDGAALSDRETFNRLLAAKRWGDFARFSVMRKEEAVNVAVLLRRESPL